MLWVGRIGLPILAGLLTVGFLPGLFGSWPWPNVVLAGLIYWIVRNRLTDALVWAVVGGLILDAAIAGRPMYLPLLVGLVMIGWLVRRRFGDQLPGLGNAALIGGLVALTVLAEAIRIGLGWSAYLVWRLLADLAGLGVLALFAQLAPRHRRLAVTV